MTSSTIAPLIVGLTAAGLLVLLMVIPPATRRLLERMRMKIRRSPEGVPMSEEWVHQTRASVEEPMDGASANVEVEPASPIVEVTSASAVVEADVGVGELSEVQHDFPVPVATNKQEPVETQIARELQRETGPVEKRPESLRILEEAHRLARDLLEEAELEAKRILVLAGREHARHEGEKEFEPSVLDEGRTTVGSPVTVRDAERQAEELLLAAEQQCAALVREAEARAQSEAAKITADARQRAAEQLEKAEQEAKAIVANTAQEHTELLSELARERSLLEFERSKLAAPSPVEAATQQAEELLVAAERGREELLRASKADAERTAAEITEGAHRQAEELVEKAELEAAGIVAAAGQERARLVHELARERSVFEETRTRLSGFLAAMLDEVESTAATGEDLRNVSDLGEARAVRRA